MQVIVSPARPVRRGATRIVVRAHAVNERGNVLGRGARYLPNGKLDVEGPSDVRRALTEALEADGQQHTAPADQVAIPTPPPLPTGEPLDAAKAFAGDTEEPPELEALAGADEPADEVTP